MASCQEGQAYTERGRASSVTANTNPSIKAYARISFSSSPYCSLRSRRGVETI